MLQTWTVKVAFTFSVPINSESKKFKKHSQANSIKILRDRTNLQACEKASKWENIRSESLNNKECTWKFKS